MLRKHLSLIRFEAIGSATRAAARRISGGGTRMRGDLVVLVHPHGPVKEKSVLERCISALSVARFHGGTYGHGHPTGEARRKRASAGGAA